MRDAKEIEKLTGMTYIASAPEGEIIVDMTIFNNHLYIVTDRHLYKLTDDKRLEQIEDMEGN